MGFVLRIAALVFFLVAALAVWATTTSLDNAVGLLACGLAAWVASTLVPGP